MVNIKRIGTGILGAGAGLLVVMEAQAGLPTFDAANIAGTISIVKNGSENIKGIGDITNKVGELNTIVGDAAASVSKFQADYGDEINKGIELAQKAMARKAEAEAAKAAHDAEVQAQKESYQAAMDTVAEQNAADMEDEEEFEEEFVEEEAEVAEELPADDMTAVMPEEESEEEEMTPPVMSSDGRVYDDEEDVGGENLDGVPGEDEELDGVSVPEEKLIENSPEITEAVVDGNAPVKAEAVVIPEQKLSAETLPSGRRPFVHPSVAGSETVPVRVAPTAVTKDNAVVVPAKLETAVPAAKKIEVAPAAAAPAVRRQFRVSPRLNGAAEKISANTYRHHEVLDFASASDSEGVGYSYIGNFYVVPMAQRCSISAETFIKDEKKRQECIETIIRENNADNSFDAALSMKECRQMVYTAVVSLLAEATNAKYEAANYSDTLDEQDKLAADSTDVRGDLTVLAMSNYQTQLLLNRISMNFSSQIILETVDQLCAARKDVLGDSDMDKASETSGEK